MANTPKHGLPRSLILSMSVRRPSSVTLLAVWVLIQALLELARAATLFVRRSLLVELDISLPVPYAIGSALAWGSLLTAAGVGLWQVARWGRWLTLLAVTGSQAQGWFDRIAFERSDYARLSTGFALATTAAVVGATWAILWWPGVRQRFEVVNR